MSEGKSTHHHLEEFQKPIPKIALGRSRADLEAGKDFSERGDKEEINAITAIFFEEIWLKTLEAIKQKPPGLLYSRIGKAVQPKGEINQYYLTEEMAEQTFKGFNGDLKKIREELQDYTNQFIYSELHEWSDQNEQKLKEGNSNDFGVKVFSRLKDKLANPKGDNIRIGMKPNSMTPEGHIHRGLNTATSTMWQTIGIIPEVFKRQFKHEITQKDFNEIAENCLPLIYAIAGSHMQVFGDLQEGYTHKFDTLINPDSFYFREVDGKLFLELKPEQVTNLEFRDQYLKEPRTGCPAIYARGESHHNVIEEMYKWFLELANKYYVPYLEK